MARAKDEAYIVQIHSLLDRVESAATHYQTLGLPPTASLDDVRDAYVCAMRVHPRSWVARRIPDELRDRAERALRFVVEAFQVLSDGHRRAEYDRRLAASSVRSVTRVGTVVSVSSVSAAPALDRAQAPARVAAPGDRREVARLGLRLPSQVMGFGHGGERWLEATQTVDVSTHGASLFVSHRVSPGRVLYVQIPLPSRLRRRDALDETGGVFSVVRWVDPPSHGRRAVGVEFLSQSPPAGFLAKPWAELDVPRRANAEARAESRFDILLTFGVRYLGDGREVIGETVGYSENVSSRGARLRLLAPLPDVDLLRVGTPDDAFVTEAIVRGRYRDPADDLDRACVQFLDGCFPVNAYGRPG